MNNSFLICLLNTIMYSMVFSFIIPEIPALFSGNLFPFSDLSLFPRFFSSSQLQKFLFSILLTCYAGANYFGASFWGVLSDRLGRKKVLLLSSYGIALGYAVSGLSLLVKSFFLLVIGEMICGFSAVHTVIAYSTVTDIFPDKEQTEKFGMISLTACWGFIIGPFFNYLLSSLLKNGDSRSSPAMQFFFLASFLHLISYFLIRFFFQETLQNTKKRGEIPSFFYAITRLRTVFSFRKMYYLFFLVTTVTFAWQMVMKFLQPLLQEQFAFSHLQIRLAYMHYGFFLMFTQFVILPLFIQRYSPERGLTRTLFFLSATLIFFTLSQNILMTFLALACMAIGEALFRPQLTTLVAKHSDETNRGEIFGMMQALQSLVKIAAPTTVFLFFFFSHNELAHILFSALIFLLVGLVIRKKKRENSANGML